MDNADGASAAGQLRSIIATPHDQLVGDGSFDSSACASSPVQDDEAWLEPSWKHRPVQDKPSRLEAGMCHAAMLAREEASLLHYEKWTEGLCSCCLDPKNRTATCKHDIR
jgi:hypothetical protein